MKKTLAAALLGATLLTGSAVAQDAPTPPQDRPMPRDPLAKADADGDGIVTRDEVLADAAARFAKLDANKDGKVTPEERDAAREGRMGRRGGPGGRMTGDMTLADMQAQAARRFDRVDTNHDGKIDQAERDAMRDRMMQMRDRQGPPPPPPADAPHND